MKKSSKLSYLGWISVPSHPSLCSFKWVCKFDLRILLQPGNKTFWCRQNNDIIEKHFYWLELRQDICKYIRSCTTCTISKISIKKHGIYTPLPTPDRPWESIFMDYMSSLPSTKHENDYVFVVVDRLSKMKILAPRKKRITTKATTKIFFEHVWVIFFSHEPWSQIMIVGSWALFGVAYGRWCTLSWPNQLPSTHRLMEKCR